MESETGWHLKGNDRFRDEIDYQEPVNERSHHMRLWCVVGMSATWPQLPLSLLCLPLRKGAKQVRGRSSCSDVFGEEVSSCFPEVSWSLYQVYRNISRLPEASSSPEIDLDLGSAGPRLERQGLQEAAGPQVAVLHFPTSWLTKGW
jgi:hypothetical protein